MSTAVQVVLQHVIRIFCVLGMAGSIATVYCFLRIRIFDVPLARSILIIGIWYFFDAMIKLVASIAEENSGPTSPFCIGMGALVQFTGLASALWMLFITIQLMLFVGFRWTKQQVLDLNNTFLVISGAVPLVCSIVLLVIKPEVGGPVFGHSVTWCWIAMSHPNIQLFAMYLPLFIILGVVFASFGYMAYVIYGHLRERRRKQIEASIDGEISEEKQNENAKRDPLLYFARGAMVYIIVFLLEWLPSALSRVYKMVLGESSAPLLYAQAICTVLRGFFNFGLYAFLAWQNKRRMDDMAANTISTIKKRPSV